MTNSIEKIEQMTKEAIKICRKNAGLVRAAVCRDCTASFHQLSGEQHKATFEVIAAKRGWANWQELYEDLKA